MGRGVFRNQICLWEGKTGISGRGAKVFCSPSRIFSPPKKIIKKIKIWKGLNNFCFSPLFSFVLDIFPFPLFVPCLFSFPLLKFLVGGGGNCFPPPPPLQRTEIRIKDWPTYIHVFLEENNLFFSDRDRSITKCSNKSRNNEKILFSEVSVHLVYWMNKTELYLYDYFLAGFEYFPGYFRRRFNTSWTSFWHFEYL